MPTATSVCVVYAARSSTSGFAHQTRLASEGSNPLVEVADSAFISDSTQAAVGANGVVHTALNRLLRPARRHVRQSGRLRANFGP